MSERPVLKIAHIADDFTVDDLDNESWNLAGSVSIGRYWSGEPAPSARHFEARLLWSDNAIYIRFRAFQHEPLVVSEVPNLLDKTMNLWDRDVCEIFVAPEVDYPQNYFEFEVAPNGEWLDVAINTTDGERKCDWNYFSGMETAARIIQNEVLMSIRIKWQAFDKNPKKGDIWHGNLFRCVGAGIERGYLAWLPTMSKVPNFHVPESFGEFVFVA